MRLTAGWVTPMRAAASVTVPDTMMARKASICRGLSQDTGTLRG